MRAAGEDQEQELARARRAGRPTALRVSNRLARVPAGRPLFVRRWFRDSARQQMTQLDMFDDPKRVPGDYGWDPLQLGTPENIDTYKARELENGRLAMLAIGGMIHGSFVTGTGAFGSTF